MNIIFKVKRCEIPNNVPLYSESTICRISSKNIIAFCIADESDSQVRFALRHNVYVCDLLSPWHVHSVCSTQNLVNVLEWNYNGDLLLIAESGCIKLWRCKNQILNSWINAFTVNLQCEKIIDCKFFHNGKRIYFNAQKKDSSLYADKFERMNFTPTLQQFGKVAAEGCIVLTSSGLLAVFYIPHVRQKNINEDSPVDYINFELTAVTHSLGLVRNYVECSAISYCRNGSFRIATSSGLQDKLVHCFNISIKFNNDNNLVITRESLPSIFLCEGYHSFGNNFKITHIKWAIIDNEELILIAYNYDQNSILEQWNLITKHQSIHKFLQKNKAEVFQCEYWENMARYHLPTNLNDICLSKNLLDSQFIYLLLKDNTVQILETGLKKVVSLNMAQYADERNNFVTFNAIDISIMNHVLIVFDNYGEMYALQVCNRYVDLKQNELLAMQISLLEYCIITGFDASDVLLLYLNNLDCLIEKLTDNFMRQPPFVRQFYYSNFLALKSNMCRMHCKQNDFDNLIILHSISIAFKSLLRPSDLACHDKGPADNLSIVLSDAVPDVDKVLLNLDAKDFTVEPLTLQSLQQLIQWVADLTLNILNKLPEDIVKNKCFKKQCYELSKDSVALTNIRELLALIRIWGLLNSHCLPIYPKSVDNFDVLAVLFRLLTRLAQNPLEPDEVLLDECITLSTQVLIPNYNFFNHVTLLNGLKTFSLVFIAGVEPVGQIHEIPTEGVVYSSGTKDGVSNIVLGSKPKKLKECVRCGFYNGFNIVPKTSAMRAWCQRWINCRCGGYWKNKI